MAEEGEGPIGSPELKQVACSMAVIRKKSEWSVFPPINHENLQTPSRLFKQEDEEEEGQNTPSSFSSDLLSSPSSSSITSSSSTSSFPPSEVGDEVGDLVEREASHSTVQVREGGHLGAWWRIGFGILRSKAWGVGWPFGCREAAGARTFWSFFSGSCGGDVAALLAVSALAVVEPEREGGSEVNASCGGKRSENCSAAEPNRSDERVSHLATKSLDSKLASLTRHKVLTLEESGKVSNAQIYGTRGVSSFEHLESFIYSIISSSRLSYIMMLEAYSVDGSESLEERRRRTP